MLGHITGRLAVVGSAAMLAGTVTTGAAVAHEGEHAGAPEAFPVTCEGVNYMITTGPGNWSAAKSTDSKTHFLPKAFTFSATGTNADGDVVFSESDTIEQGNGNAHKNQETITCVFGETFVEDGVTIEFEGTAVVVRKP